MLFYREHLLHTSGEYKETYTFDKEKHPVTTFNKNDGQKADLPFSVSLKQFQLTYYQGTFAPMDFISILNVYDGPQMHEGSVSMNHIYTYRNYRFYQSTYDADKKGSTLSIAYDPYGIALAYTGYVYLLALVYSCSF